MNETTTHVLERAGSRIHYWLSGSDDRPLVVFTHGATMDHRLFDAQVGAFERDYRVLTWDVRGHGRSKPIGDDYSIPAAAEDLFALIEAAGYRSAALVGQSMGSYISQEAIFRNPSIAWAFASIGAICITMRYPRAEHWLLRLAVPLTRLYPYRLLKRVVASAVSVTPAGQAYALEAMNRVSRAEYAEIMSAVARCLHEEPGYHIPCPTLLTHGDHDNTGSIKKHAQTWANRDANGRVLVIPNAGHNANYDNPAFLNDVLGEFLADHAPTDAHE